jgi:hypothetical protein
VCIDHTSHVVVACGWSIRPKKQREVNMAIKTEIPYVDANANLTLYAHGEAVL